MLWQQGTICRAIQVSVLSEWVSTTKICSQDQSSCCYWVMQLHCITPVPKSRTCKVAIGNKVDADPVVMESQAKVAHVGPIVAVDISREQLHVQLHKYI